MSLLDMIIRWLTPRRTAASPGRAHAGVPPIDVQAVIDRLDLEGEGRRLGAAGIPAPDARALTGPELKAMALVEAYRHDVAEAAKARLLLLDEGIARCDATQDVNRALQAGDEFERRASTLMSSAEAQLRGLAAHAARARQQLDDFRQRAGLARDPVVHGVLWSAIRWMLLALAVMLEAGLNAALFAQGLDSGLLGGFFMAGLLAFVNVAIAFLLGRYMVRYAFHARPLPRLAGGLAWAAAAGLIAFLGLGIAQVRDALNADLKDPAVVALAALQGANRFQLHDVFSYALWLVSGIFGLVALLDGLFAVDLYPGYTRVAVAAMDAQAAFDEGVAEVGDALEALREAALAQVERTAGEVAGRVAALASLVGDKREAANRLGNGLREADLALRAVLGAFRSANEMARPAGTPRPAWFDEPPPLSPLRLPDFAPASDQAILEAQRALVNGFLQQVEAIRSRIQAAYVQSFDHLKPLGVHFSATPAASGEPALSPGTPAPTTTTPPLPSAP